MGHESVSQEAFTKVTASEWAGAWLGPGTWLLAPQGKDSHVCPREARTIKAFYSKYFCIGLGSARRARCGQS